MSYSHNNQLNMVSLFDEEHPQHFNKRSYDMTRLHPNNPYYGLAGQAPAVAPIKIEEGAAPQTTGQGQGQGLTTQSRPSLIVKLKAPLLTDRNCHGNVIIGKNYIPPIEPQFSMADDIHSTGGRGITVVSGLPNVPSDSGPKYPDIVKQAVPTQYKRGAGMDFDFDKYIKKMEAHDYEEDVKDHAEYDFVSNDSHEDLLASSEAEQAAMTSSPKPRPVFTRWLQLPPRSKASRKPFRYQLI